MSTLFAQLFILEGSSRTSLLHLAACFVLRSIGGQLIPLVHVPALSYGLTDGVLSEFCMVSNEESGQSALICIKSDMRDFWYFRQLFQFYIVFIYFVFAFFFVNLANVSG